MRYLAIIFVVFLTQSSFSQDTLSLKYFLKLGLERNYAVQIVRNNEAIAANNVTPGNAGMLPTLSANGRYSGSMINSRLVRDNAQPIEKTNVKTTNLSSGANVNWNIFDGFQMFIEYNRLNELQKLGELSTRMTIENLIADISTEYFNLIQQKKRLQTLSYVMTLSKERLNVARERYLIGSFSKLEYQEAVVDFNADSSSYMQQELAVSTSKLTLSRILAIDPSTLTDGQDSLMIDSTLIYNDLNKSTMTNNTSLLIASKSQTLSELELKLINSQTYPVLSLTGGYSYSKALDPANIITERQLSGWNYGASLTFNIFDGWRLQRERANARIALKNTEIRYKDLEQGIISNLLLMYNLYQNQLKVVSLEKSNLRTAHNNFQIATERYLLGALSGLEMRTIQRAYLDAEDRLISALYRAKIAEISLKLISGRIQEYL